MQSLRQYRSLKRRLQQRYSTGRETSTGLPASVNTFTSQEPDLRGRARQDEDLEKQNFSPLDLQNAINASAPSTITGADAGEGISTQASTIGLDSLNSTAHVLDSTTTLPQSFTGFNLPQKDLKPSREDSAVYAVELGDDDNDINPQKWGRAFKIWATYANLSTHH